MYHTIDLNEVDITIQPIIYYSSHVVNLAAVMPKRPIFIKDLPPNIQTACEKVQQVLVQRDLPIMLFAFCKPSNQNPTIYNPVVLSSQNGALRVGLYFVRHGNSLKPHAFMFSESDTWGSKLL